MTDYWQTVGSVALIAAITSAIVSIWGVSRNIKHKAVIEERQSWRLSLRELVPALVREQDLNERERIRNSIVLRLNPYKDQEAINLLNEYVSAPSPQAERALVAHFQAMLKLEWQRAKVEAGILPWGANWRACLSVNWQRWRAERSGRADANQPAP